MPGPQPRRELTSGARQAMPFIQSLVSEGLSATAIVSTLQRAGSGARRADVLQIVRDLRGAELAADRLKFIPRGLKPDPELLPFAVTKQLREYSFTVRVSGYDPVAGIDTERYFNVSSTENLSVEDIEAEAMAFAEDEEEYGPFEVGAITVITATRQFH